MVGREARAQPHSGRDEILQPRGGRHLQVMHKGGHDDVLVTVAVEVMDERRGIHAGADLRHPLQCQVCLARVLPCVLIRAAQSSNMLISKHGCIAWLALHILPHVLTCAAQSQK